ncbi:unnamed protein product [Phaedon cochleariae]|uniref:JmjC domain-containing protein n=1 Tax=Phaedon cochleariae TaxID=80249 RepID=A0A9P0DGG9_PHACE|nr:unnamed protein product [Phaedon cochleariae]
MSNESGLFETFESNQFIGMMMKFINDRNKLMDLQCSKLNKTITEKLKECLSYCLERNTQHRDLNKSIEIETILDFLHDELNTGHWSNVPLYVRHNFSTASFAKCLILILNKKPEESLELLLKKCLKCLDMGLLLGAPLENNEDLLTSSAKYLNQEIGRITDNPEKRKSHEQGKRKLDHDFKGKFDELKGIILDSVELPSLEHFNKTYFLPQQPVKLKGCMEHWPASKKWLDINYLLKIAGDRTVPIEVGSHYVDENWSQKLMTLREFITRHYLSDSGNVGYLAQHNLFEQISELKEDIHIPEYCCLSTDYENSTDPDINAWFGPGNTVSPLHHDPKNNILAQVYGSKQVVLFSPKDTPYLYPHEDKLLNNTAQVNPIDPDLEKFQEYSKASMYKCLLEPGEMLFIPVKWWHHVTSLEKSFSVSFWWQ